MKRKVSILENKFFFILTVVIVALIITISFLELIFMGSIYFIISNFLVLVIIHLMKTLH